MPLGACNDFSRLPTAFYINRPGLSYPSTYSKTLFSTESFPGNPLGQRKVWIFDPCDFRHGQKGHPTEVSRPSISGRSSNSRKTHRFYSGVLSFFLHSHKKAWKADPTQETKNAARLST